MSRVVLLGTVGLGALMASAGLAQAQEFDWSGVYVGGSLGAGVIDTHAVYDGSEWYSYREGALTALATAGINWQDGQLVYGLEGDIGLVSHGDAETDDMLDPSLVSASASPVATLRGRFGFASGNALFYGTAGLAVANVDVEDNNESAFTGSGVVVGPVFGAGIEYAIADGISIKAEGRISSLALETSDSYTNNVNSGVGLVGVNFHF